MVVVKELQKRAIIGWGGFGAEPKKYQDAENALENIPRNHKGHLIVSSVFSCYAPAFPATHHLPATRRLIHATRLLSKNSINNSIHK